ncbi:MAG: hypothetical protein ABI353_11900 [Isosphaeraceae bacterium]
MKRVLKAVLKAFWRLTAPVRRPVSIRLARWQQQILAASLREEVIPHLVVVRSMLDRIEQERGHLQAIEHAINASRCLADARAEEANLALDSHVRELSRLQRQVEELRQCVEDGTSLRDRLGLVGESSDVNERMAG